MVGPLPDGKVWVELRDCRLPAALGRHQLGNYVCRWATVDPDATIDDDDWLVIVTARAWHVRIAPARPPLATIIGCLDGLFWSHVDVID